MEGTKKEEKPMVIWLDANVEKGDNPGNLDAMKEGCPQCEFVAVDSLEKAMKKLEEPRNDFRLVYFIVSGRLSDKFFLQYTVKMKTSKYICAGIVFCSDDKFQREAPYYTDNFLNSGEICTGTDEIVAYINKDVFKERNEQKISWEEQLNAQRQLGPSKPDSNTFYMDKSYNINDFSFPILLGFIVNSSVINKHEVAKFRDFVFKYGDKELSCLVNPGREKKIRIPYPKLAKFFGKMLLKDDFYRDMNNAIASQLKVTKEQWNQVATKGANALEFLGFTKDYIKYRPYILTLIEGLNRGSLEPSKDELFLYAKLRKLDIEKTYRNVCQKGNDDKEFNFLNIPTFTKFFKDQKDSEEYFKAAFGETFDSEKEGIVRYVLDEVNDEELQVDERTEYFYPNIDMSKLVGKEDEKTVFFLPTTTLEIVSTGRDTMELNGKTVPITTFRLKYFFKRKKTITDFLMNTENEKDWQKFYEKSLQTPVADYVLYFLGPKLNYLYRLFIENLTTVPLKPFLDKKSLSNQVLHKKLLDKGLIRPATTELSASTEISWGVGLIKEKAEAEKEEKEEKNAFELDKEALKEKAVDSLSKFSNFCCELNEAEGEEMEYEDAYEKGKEDAATGEFDVDNEVSQNVSFFIPVLQKGAALFNLGSNPLLDAFLGSAAELAGGLADILGDKDSSTKEKIKDASLLVAGSVTSTLVEQTFKQIGMVIATPFGPGGVMIGYAMGKAGQYFGEKVKGFFHKFMTEKKLTLFSNSMYSGYIPKRYRKKSPHLGWKYGSKEATYYAIEMIVNMRETHWRVINIPNDIYEFQPEQTGGGDELIKFEPIPSNVSRVDYVLYEFNCPTKLKPEDWKKTDVIQKYLINVAVLNAF